MELLRPETVEEAVAALGNGAVPSAAAPTSCRCCATESSRADTLVELRRAVPRGITGVHLHLQRAQRLRRRRGHDARRARGRARRSRRRCARPAGSPRRRSCARQGRSAATCSRRPAAGTGASRSPATCTAATAATPRRASTASTRSSATSCCASAHPSDPAAALLALRRPPPHRSARARARRALPPADRRRPPTHDARARRADRRARAARGDVEHLPEGDGPAALGVRARRRRGCARRRRDAHRARRRRAGAVAARLARGARRRDAAAGDGVQGRDRAGARPRAVEALSLSSAADARSRSCSSCSRCSLAPRRLRRRRRGDERLTRRQRPTTDDDRDDTLDGRLPRRPAVQDVEAPEPKPDGGSPPPEDDLDATRRTASSSRRAAARSRSTLDQELAPKTAASLVSLARRTASSTARPSTASCPGFVIQGGDPTGTGSGGPGYQTVDVPPADAGYTQGVVAMAKTGAEPPGTSGSQFFVVTGPDVGLPPEYAIVGEVTEGLETCAAIEALGVADGPPSQPVVIEKRHRRRELMPVLAAVVLAAGAATRFGSPEAAAAPRRASSRAARARSTRSSSSPARTTSTPTRASSRCPDWERGPGASLRCGLAALPAGAEAAVVVLADGPDALGDAVERVVAAWREHGAPFVAASYGGVARPPAAGGARESGRRSRRRPARPRAAARPVRRPRPPGRRRPPGDLPQRFRTTPDEPM